MPRTPLLNYNGLFLKCEHHLAGGSYKARGVETFLESLPSNTKKIRTLSAGNMARTLALLAPPRGIEVEALVPSTIPAIKREKLEALGVSLTLIPMEKLWSEVDNPTPVPYPLLHPVDSENLLRGYANIAHEILEEAHSISEVIIPIGVGGLSIALARVLSPKVKVVLAENAVNATFSSGRPIPRINTWIDAIGTPYTLERVRNRLTPLISEVRTVSPETALSAARQLYQATGERIEGAAAVALAAAQKPNSVILLTGQNVAPNLFSTQYS